MIRRMKVGGTTQAQKVLLSGVDLHNDYSFHSFTTAQLAVRAWRNYPDVFGLQGFEHSHPDNKKVESSVFGQRGLVSLGLMKKAPKSNEGDYFVTEKGREAVRILNEKPSPPANIEPWVVPFITAATNHYVLEDWRAGADCLEMIAFWSDVAGGRPQFRGMLGRLRDMIPVTMPDGTEFGETEWSELEKMDSQSTLCLDHANMEM